VGFKRTAWHDSPGLYQTRLALPQYRYARPGVGPGVADAAQDLSGTGAEVTVSRDVARRRTERELHHLTGRHLVEAASEAGETSGDFGLVRHFGHHRSVRGEVERALARHPRA
jgi:hypothetical protein